MAAGGQQKEKHMRIFHLAMKDHARDRDTDNFVYIYFCG
jgi:hypothetical protein